ncbi:MAG: hypothetical protein KF723_21160 [Rhizobiaceae bacterium]|nr:hypothetical protein [Rhizobiaceae bacterium]
MNPLAPVYAVQRYVGRVRTFHREIRTIRYLNTLPASIRKDIGWPDSCDFEGAPGRRV